MEKKPLLFILEANPHQHQTFRNAVLYSNSNYFIFSLNYLNLESLAVEVFTPRHVRLRRASSSYATSYKITPRLVQLRNAMLNYATPLHVTQRQPTPRNPLFRVNRLNKISGAMADPLLSCQLVVRSVACLVVRLFTCLVTWAVAQCVVRIGAHDILLFLRVKRHPLIS